MFQIIEKCEEGVFSPSKPNQTIQLLDQLRGTSEYPKMPRGLFGTHLYPLVLGIILSPSNTTDIFSFHTLVNKKQK